MLHDNKKKTIYYNNAVIKVYNILFSTLQDYLIQILQLIVESGFLIPSLVDTQNLEQV